jgi:hypothetical protein
VAYLGLGDVRFALRPGDSLYTIVADRLNRIARPPSEIR